MRLPAMPDPDARALAQELRLRGDVLVRYVDPQMALKRLRVELGELATALDGLSKNPLPPRSLCSFAERLKKRLLSQRFDCAKPAAG